VIINIKGLRAMTLLGVYPHERKEKREVLIDLAIEYDASAAMQSDTMEDALDYALIEQEVINSVRDQRYELLEALTKHIADVVMHFDVVQAVTVQVHKPGALVHAPGVSFTYAARR